MLFELPLKNISEYLFSRKWSNQESGKYFSVWTLGEEEILLPNSKQLANYIHRISDAFQILESVESRPRYLIAYDCAMSLSDVIKIRVDNEDITHGNIDIDSGLSIYKSARQMMFSSAYSLKRLSSKYTGTTNEVSEFMRSVKFGRPEEGSFIVNIIVPLEGSNPAQSEISSKFQRKVSNRLIQSINFIANNEIDDEEKFDLAIENGISHNLCQAISGISPIVNEQGIRISLNKSSFLDKEDFGMVEKSVEYSKLEAIRKVSRKLQSYTYRGNTHHQININEEKDRQELRHQIRGRVLSMEWKGAGFPYCIKVDSKSDDREYQVHLATKKDFKRATNANLNESIIVLVGELDNSHTDMPHLNNSEILTK